MKTELMKKLICSFIFSLCFINTAVASEKNINPLELCPQMYLSNPAPAYQGSTAECRKLWNFYVRKKSYCGMALMTFNGLGGQKASKDVAIKYAEKLKNVEAACEPEFECGCSKDNFLNLINQWGEVTDQHYLTYLQMRAEVDVGHNITLLRYMFGIEVEGYKTKHQLDSMVISLSNQQQTAFQTTWTNFQHYLNFVGEAFPEGAVCEVFGYALINWQTDIQRELLTLFQDDVTMLLRSSLQLSNSSPISDKEVIRLDKELNATFIKLRGGAELKTAWSKYKKSYLRFISLYVASENTKAVQRVIYHSLAKKQLILLEEWISAYSGEECG